MQTETEFTFMQFLSLESTESMGETETALEEGTAAVEETETDAAGETRGESELDEETETETESEGDLFDPADLKEEDIYTFFQGPRAWKARAAWSGSWNSMILGGQEFSIFGCGLCCLANMYCTLTPYTCSPVDMFYYAQEVTDYAPSSGYGAIDWSYMRKTLQKTGINSKLRRKDKTYEEFQKSIAGGITAIVLVSSVNDDTYWDETGGHYVNIWLYNSEDDTVFLADSGNMEHNRARIPLRYVYDALKTSSKYQYLLVTSVDPEGNTWQHDGIKERWRKPKYLPSLERAR